MRKPRFFWPLVIILVVAITAGIITLFVRGFRFSDLTETKDNITTPEVTVWAVTVPGFTTKMDAYKAAYGHSDNGYGVFARAEKEQWSWVLGVYDSVEEAEAFVQNATLPDNVVTNVHQIVGQRFRIKQEIAAPANQMLALLETIHQQLVTTRTAALAGEQVNDAIMTLTDSYQQLRSLVDDLQAMNSTENIPLLSAIIYIGNQNILALFEVVFADINQRNNFLSVLNTAIIQNIFSLDNWQ